MNTATGSFDLLAEPWIPALDRQGRLRRLGLLETLRQAHELETLDADSPLVVCALYRFLAAVLQDALPVARADDWEALWKQGRFSGSQVNRVEERCRGRMNLFDGDYPFYQSGDIPLTGPERKEAKSVGYLFPEAPAGGYAAHFSHAGEDAHACCPACCAHGLVALPAFATAGGRSIPRSINGDPPFYVVPRGASLFQTLLLNHLLPIYHPSTAAKRDPGPLWRQGGLVGRNEERAEVGFIESLTWPPRRVRLFPEDDPGPCSRCGAPAPARVRRMVFEGGRSRPQGAEVWRDPWVPCAMRQAGEAGQPVPVPLRPEEERDVWRDFPTLFLQRDQKRGERPRVLEQVDYLMSEGCLPPDPPGLCFEVFGMRSDQAKAFEWTHTVLDFPAALLRDGRAAGPVSDALTRAEGVAGVLARALRQLHPLSERAKPDPKAVRAAMQPLVTRAQRAYWQRLELPFREALRDPRLQADDAAQRQWVEAWLEQVRGVSTRVFEDAVEPFDATADELKRQQAARHVFYGWRKKHLELNGGTR